MIPGNCTLFNRANYGKSLEIQNKKTQPISKDNNNGNYINRDDIRSMRGYQLPAGL